MKKSITSIFTSCIIAITFLISCGQSKEEIQKKKTADSLAVVIRETAVKDSMNKVNGMRQADSLTNLLNEAVNTATETVK